MLIDNSSSVAEAPSKLQTFAANFAPQVHCMLQLGDHMVMVYRQKRAPFFLKQGSEQSGEIGVSAPMVSNTVSAL